MIEEVPLAHSWRRVDFEGGSAPAIAIAWGDLATAWFSTGIPNIETYVKVPFAVAIAGPALNWARPLLASAPGQAVLQQLANLVPDLVKTSWARGGPACGARCVMLRGFGGRRGWRPLTGTA